MIKFIKAAITAMAIKIIIIITLIPDGLVITGSLSFTPVTVTEMVAVPVRGGAASSTAITCKS